jgi:hypothetical protein
MFNKFPTQLIVLNLTLLLSATASAQILKPLGESNNGSKLYLVNNKSSMRIGKGVLFWVMQEYENATGAGKYFYSCDGKYSSTSSLSYAMSFHESADTRRNEVFDSIKTSSNYDTSSVSIDDFESVNHDLKYKIRTQLKEICANSLNEEKGTYLPFFTSLYDKNQTASIASLVIGTFSRKSEFVEGWVKIHRIKNVEMKKTNGEVYRKVDGTPLMLDELKDDGYSMAKYSVNCKQEKYAALTYSDYDKYGTQTPKSFTPSHATYQDPVPSSLGENIVQTFCRIY